MAAFNPYAPLPYAYPTYPYAPQPMTQPAPQSNNSYRSYDDRSYRGSYDGDMGGDSYARGRSQRTGRYVSREAGYSGHEDYAKTLETMLRQTGDPKKQEAIREALSALQSR